MIQKFIEENNLEFKEGTRNADCVVILGYSQHLGLKQADLKTALTKYIEVDSFIGEEIERLWDYCKNKNYKDFWTKAVAKEQYKF
jgi:hypothetical protein